MNISREQKDALNAVITIDIVKSDYAENVEKTLNRYRKTANMPGFRKGHVPMGMIQRQFGKAIKFDEINEITNRSLNEYIYKEKIGMLGNPLPIVKDIDIEADDFQFQFEIGLAPTFEVNLKPAEGILRYEIEVDEPQIDKQIERIQKQFGKLVSKGEVLDNEDIELTGTFFNEEKNIESQATFKLTDLSPEVRKTFIGKKVGDQFQLQTKGLFEDAHSLMHYLKVSHDEAHHLDVEVTFTLEEINEREKAALDADLFSKLFPDGSVTTEEQLRAKIKEGAELQFNEQADQHFLNTVTDYLVDNTHFDLPAAFLKKWLRTAGEKELTEQEANEEYERSERGLRYQLIEAKIMNDNNLQPTNEEIKEFGREYIKAQLLQYGMPADDDAQVDSILDRILKNHEEVQRIQQQVVFKKLIAFYKENAAINTKKVTFDEFIKLAFPE